ncbi:unnamed protein product [Schistosoma margrebowiei]|uniref:Uncharacterized protein n=1 Tax=Schistosoma margrebowiei TaxID=48269 RepID=A0A183MTU6_9TREM|nr:unnamed protein product [Schistosoma margrebowiei]
MFLLNNNCMLCPNCKTFKVNFSRFKNILISMMKCFCNHELPPIAPSNSTSLPTTVPKTNPTICRLHIRLPSGQSIKGEFGVNEPLSAVTLYVSQNWPNSSTFIDPQSIQLMTSFPKQEFTSEDRNRSKFLLKILNLMPTAACR